VVVDMSGSVHDCPMIEEAVEILGADRILFGTDNGFSSCIGKILGADIPENHKKTILEGTRYLRFIERAGKQ
jgi:predicted TIM-barrel fold metal-dependent hydrolase